MPNIIIRAIKDNKEYEVIRDDERWLFEWHDASDSWWITTWPENEEKPMNWMGNTIALPLSNRIEEVVAHFLKLNRFIVHSEGNDSTSFVVSASDNREAMQLALQKLNVNMQKLATVADDVTIRIIDKGGIAQ